MSTSTSPGNASLKPKETGKTVSSHLPITSIVDPVALIDARIKVIIGEIFFVCHLCAKTA